MQPFSASAGGRFTAGRLAATVLISAAIWAGIVLACSFLPVLDTLTWGIWRLRLLRLIPASLVGAGLAVAGVAFQSLLRNPLADPYVLGISSGSAVGAMLAMITGAFGAITPLAIGSTTLAAACGGVATIVVVYLVAQRRGRLDPYTLLMTGVILNAFNGAIIMFLYLVATQPVFRDITIWAMGQVREQSNPLAVVLAGAVILGGWVVLLINAKAFNVQAMGDDVAASAGVHVQALRLTTFASGAVMTAASVALAGPVPFVGLMIPHITRRILGADHRMLLVTSGFVGAAFLAAADTLCRASVQLRTGELPVGIITALTGGPFFIYLLRRRLKERP